MIFALTFLKKLYVNWSLDEIPRHSAAIAYYTAFSLPAFTLVVLSIAGKIIGPVTVQHELFERLRETLGENVTDLLRTTLLKMESSSSSSLFQIFSIILLIVAAIGVFHEIQASLNAILQINPKSDTFVHYIGGFALSFILVVITAVLLAVAVGCSAILQLISIRASVYFSLQIDFLSTINNLVTEGSMIILFFLLYFILPARKLPIFPVLICSIITSTLLFSGTLFLTYYITHSSISEIYGVAASLLILLFWLYYSANIFLLGAELIDTWMFFMDQPKKQKGLFSRWF